MELTPEIEVVEVGSEEELVAEVCASVEKAVAALMIGRYGIYREDDLDY